MSAEGSISRWLSRLKAGDPQAAADLWQRYFARLVEVARGKLKGAPRRAADEEDVALSAFDSLCRGVEGGRFPQLADRDSLWRLLVVLTARKAAHLKRDASRQKRGGGQLAAGAEEADLERLLDAGPTPAFAAQMEEESQRLLDGLGDDELRAVALWKMEGYSNEEIAQRLGCGLRSVGRKLRVIRALWAQEAGDGGQTGGEP
jgi:DNA-directed RNA polymerase specialized sigma24 family protein